MSAMWATESHSLILLYSRPSTTRARSILSVSLKMSSRRFVIDHPLYCSATGPGVSLASNVPSPAWLSLDVHESGKQSVAADRAGEYGGRGGIFHVETAGIPTQRRRLAPGHEHRFQTFWTAHG